jgi:RNA polymerase sigma-70 factor (ECF subfamily)
MRDARDDRSIAAPHSFERLFDAHAQDLFGFVVYRTGDRALAEEIVADTFERAFSARHRFDRRRGSEKSWLYGIALNRLHDLNRRAATESRAVEQLASAADRPAAMDARVNADQDLHRALLALPPDERDALALRYGGDLTVREVAKALGEPVSRVEGRVYRGLRRLRDQLEPD